MVLPVGVYRFPHLFYGAERGILFLPLISKLYSSHLTLYPTKACTIVSVVANEGKSSSATRIIQDKASSRFRRQSRFLAMQPRTPLERAVERSKRRQSQRLQDMSRPYPALAPPQANESASPPPAARKATKRRSSALQDVTNIKSRKRGDSSSPSDDSVHSAKKNKRIEQTTTVTPMMTGKTNSIFPCYDVDSMFPLAHPQKPIPGVIPLPDGVANIYPHDDDKVCTCDENHCSSRSLSHSYLRHYGQEYSQSLRDWEDAYFVHPETGGHSSASSSSSSSSSPSSQEDDGLSHRATPPRRVNYVNRRIADTEQHSTESSVSSQALLHQPHLSEKMREVLVDWMIELSEEYHLSTKTLHLTIALLNRALERGEEESDDTGVMPFVIGREMFQCLGWYVLISPLELVRFVMSHLLFSVKIIVLACGWLARLRKSIPHQLRILFTYPLILTQNKKSRRWSLPSAAP